jgi:CheY-like chemotaxis protein
MERKPDIIIIDDDPTVTDLIQSYLADFDVVVQTYNNPIHALNMIIHLKPRVVFVDLNMSAMRGDQVIVKLSEKYIFQTTSLFLLTNQELSEFERMKQMTLGFDHIISKPVQSKDVYHAIESIMGSLQLKQNKAA